MAKFGTAKSGTTKLYQILPRHLRTEAICLGVMVVTFAVDACSYSTIWNCCPKYCHFFESSCQIFTAPHFAIPNFARSNPPPPSPGIVQATSDGHACIMDIVVVRCHGQLLLVAPTAPMLMSGPPPAKSGAFGNQPWPEAPLGGYMGGRWALGMFALSVTGEAQPTSQRLPVARAYAPGTGPLGGGGMGKMGSCALSVCRNRD